MQFNLIIYDTISSSSVAELYGKTFILFLSSVKQDDDFHTTERRGIGNAPVLVGKCERFIICNALIQLDMSTKQEASASNTAVVYQM